MKKVILSFLAVASGLTFTQAQTVSTFENVPIPQDGNVYSDTFTTLDTTFSFSSGNATFQGNLSYGYWGGFNVSNDTATSGYNGNVTGQGYNHSQQYGIAFVNLDWTSDYQPIPVGIKLTGDAVGHPVQGTYITNSNYAYDYITSNSAYTVNHGFFKLTARGYLNGQPSADTTLYLTLADYTDTSHFALHTWEWFDLTPLGNVDSVAFSLYSSDTGDYGLNTPAYFVMDNFTTSDGLCDTAPNHFTLTATASGSVLAQWDPVSTNGQYAIAIDQTADLTPTGTIYETTDTFYNFSNLVAGTPYYVHLRSSCGSDYMSQWSVQTITLAGTGIDDIANPLHVTLYPNPARDQLIILSDKQLTATIYSITGQLIRQPAPGKVLPVAHLAAGMYLLQLTDGTQTSRLKFVKQ